MSHNYFNLPWGLKWTSYREWIFPGYCSLSLTSFHNGIVDFSVCFAFVRISFQLLLFVEVNPFLSSPGHIFTLLYSVTCNSWAVDTIPWVPYKLFRLCFCERALWVGKWREFCLIPVAILHPNMELCLGRSSACHCEALSSRIFCGSAQRICTTSVPWPLSVPNPEPSFSSSPDTEGRSPPESVTAWKENQLVRDCNFKIIK